MSSPKPNSEADSLRSENDSKLLQNIHYGAVNENYNDDPYHYNKTSCTILTRFGRDAIASLEVIPGQDCQGPR